MQCLDANQVLDLLARRLDDAQRDAAERHVAECSDCQALLSELARLPLIDELAAPDLEAAGPVRIGRYHLHERLGVGGMGVVHAAYDPELDRRVALKLVRPELATTDALQRLLREARALARLSHPNVVPVHDAGIAGDQLFVAMELVSGPTLARWLRAERRTWREVVHLFSAAGRGLAAAHQAGLVHRDFKPENVLLGEDGRPRVSDFGLVTGGLAEPVPERDVPASPGLATGVATRLTRTGVLLGTPAFMAPEQYAGRPEARSDQFSFCASLFDALYGERPFAGKTIEELAAAVQAGAVRVPSHPGRVPRWLRRAVRRGLAPRADDRFPTMEALLAAIDPRPRARRARAFGFAAALALVAVATLLIAPLGGGTAAEVEAGECRAAAAARAALWTADDQAAIRRAVEATGKPSATETWDRVRKSADIFVAQLAAAETTICSRLPRTDEARAEFQLGMECLADRRTTFADVLAALRRTDGSSLNRAVFLVHDIQTPAHCADLSELRGLRHVLARPGGAAALAELRRQLLVVARGQRARGAYAEALATAQQTAERARQLDAGPMVARALLAAGEYAILAEGDVSSEKIYREAAALAESLAFDDARAIAMVRLMLVVSRQPGREQEGLALEPLVAAAVARCSNPQAIRPMLDQAVGFARFQLGQYQAALERLQAALDAARVLLPADDPRFPDYLSPVGVVLSRLGRSREAAEIQTRLVAAAEALHGRDHPEVARQLARLAASQSVMGRCDLALPHQRRARSILERAAARDSSDYLDLLGDMGSCHASEKRHDDAMREFEEILTILDKAGKARSPEAAWARGAIGDIHVERGDRAAAARAYRTAIDLIEDEIDNRDIRLVYPLSRLAEIHLASGRPRAARPLAERSVAIATAQQTDEVSAAEARFVLARVLWPDRRARTRARELAERALAAYRSAGPDHDDHEAEVGRWLAERAGRRAERADR